MRQRLTIILTFAVIIGLLALVSSIRYVRKEKQQDFEIAPNRSTYHSGPTGVRAFFDFLHESGYKVIRWRDQPQKLLTDAGKEIKTFVVVGQTRVRFTDAESEALTKWIAEEAVTSSSIVSRSMKTKRRRAKPIGTSSRDSLNYPAYRHQPGQSQTNDR